MGEFWYGGVAVYKTCSVIFLLSFQTVVADACGYDDDSNDRGSKSGH